MDSADADKIVMGVSGITAVRICTRYCGVQSAELFAEAPDQELPKVKFARRGVVIIVLYDARRL